MKDIDEIQALFRQVGHESFQTYDPVVNGHNDVLQEILDNPTPEHCADIVEEYYLRSTRWYRIADTLFWIPVVGTVADKKAAYYNAKMMKSLTVLEGSLTEHNNTAELEYSDTTRSL